MQSEALEGARREMHEATQAFLAVRDRRQELFLRCFEHIQSVIDPIYKELTRSTVSRPGRSPRLGAAAPR